MIDIQQIIAILMIFISIYFLYKEIDMKRDENGETVEEPNKILIFIYIGILIISLFLIFKKSKTQESEKEWNPVINLTTDPKSNINFMKRLTNKRLNKIKRKRKFRKK